MERNTALDFFFTVMRLFFGAVYDLRRKSKRHGFQFQTGYKTSKRDKFDSILIDIDQIASAERVITVNNAVQ